MTEKYSCDICCYYTLKKYNYKKHLDSCKHINNINLCNNKDNKNNNELSNLIIKQKHLCKFCNKEYSSRQSLHDHLKKCKEKNKEIPNNQIAVDSIKQILQNKEIMTELLHLCTFKMPR